jgi:hypothetical protein
MGVTTDYLREAYVIAPTRATCPAHRILLTLTPLIINGEEYNVGSLCVRNFLQTAPPHG